MKFLYSHRTRSADGQYVHIRTLTEALIRAGHQLTMAGPEGEGPYKALSAGGGIGKVRARLPGPLYECAEYGYSFLARRRLASLMKQSPQQDVIYERYNLYFHAGTWLKKRTGLPLILEVNAPLVDERTSNSELTLGPIARMSENAIWRAADHVLPVTNVLADYVRRAGVPEEKITVIQNGVDANFLAEPDGRAVRARYGLDDKMVLGFTGFVRDWHGVDRVLRFIAQAERRDLHLLLVGDGPARENLQSLSRELGIANQFTVTGIIQRQDIAAHVSAMDIALQPAAVAYASPLKLFEYMGLARCILAPRQPNICEVLVDGEDAALFSSDSDGEFRTKLRELINDDELRRRLGGNARNSLKRQELTWDANARRVAAIAKSVVERA